MPSRNEIRYNEARQHVLMSQSSKVAEAFVLKAGLEIITDLKWEMKKVYVWWFEEMEDVGFTGFSYSKVLDDSQTKFTIENLLNEIDTELRIYRDTALDYAEAIGRMKRGIIDTEAEIWIDQQFDYAEAKQSERKNHIKLYRLKSQQASAGIYLGKYQKLRTILEYYKTCLVITKYVSEVPYHDAHKKGLKQVVMDLERNTDVMLTATKKVYGDEQENEVEEILDTDDEGKDDIGFAKLADGRNSDELLRHLQNH